MGKRIVKVEVTRYYSKTKVVEVEVDENIVDEELVEFLTNDDDVNDLYENAIGDASLVGENTTYEWRDEINNNGGTI